MRSSFVILKEIERNSKEYDNWFWEKDSEATARTVFRDSYGTDVCLPLAHFQSIVNSIQSIEHPLCFFSII